MGKTAKRQRRKGDKRSISSVISFVADPLIVLVLNEDDSAFLGEREELESSFKKRVNEEKGGKRRDQSNEAERN